MRQTPFHSASHKPIRRTRTHFLHTAENSLSRLRHGYLLLITEFYLLYYMIAYYFYFVKQFFAVFLQSSKSLSRTMKIIYLSLKAARILCVSRSARRVGTGIRLSEPTVSIVSLTAVSREMLFPTDTKTGLTLS